MPSIKRHSVLVIGGTSGIGFAVAGLALEAGAGVAIASSNASRVETAVEKLKSSFPEGKIEGHVCDASGDDIEAHLDKLFTDVTDGGKGLLDHVVYTAGRSPSVKPLEEMNLEYILQTTKLFSSQFLVAKLSLRYLKGTPSSSLTFTGGHISENPMPNYTIFTTYAAGLIGMVRNLALDMAPRRVNLVSVGSAITEMWGPNREQIAEVVGKINLLGKVARPEEVAEAFTYLMKDWNATGSVVSSNGGSLLQ